MKTPDTYCNSPNEIMNSAYVYAAKKECDSMPSCHMFYHYRGSSNTFYACKTTSSVGHSTVGSVLYQLLTGNKNIGGINLLDMYHLYNSIVA